MKPNLPTLIVLLFVTCNSFAQLPQKFSYLVVNINKSQDKVENRDYYVIDAEQDNANAASIYALARYSNKAAKKNEADTSSQPYNYFKSIGEALNFLDRQGWQLLSVYNHIYTNVYERVRSEPVYYLRKEITTPAAGTHNTNP